MQKKDKDTKAKRFFQDRGDPMPRPAVFDSKRDKPKHKKRELEALLEEYKGLKYV